MFIGVLLVIAGAMVYRFGRELRKAGELLAEMPKNKGAKGQLTGRDSSGGRTMRPPEASQTLADIGISRDQWPGRN